MTRPKGSRNKATIEALLSPDLPINLDELVKSKETTMTPKSYKLLAKTIHLHAPSELGGARPTFTSRDSQLEVTPIGVKMRSKKTKRILLVPWANIKMAELVWEEDAEG